jgi:hypothetical protein
MGKNWKTTSEITIVLSSILGVFLCVNGASFGYFSIEIETALAEEVAVAVALGIATVVIMIK